MALVGSHPTRRKWSSAVASQNQGMAALPACATEEVLHALNEFYPGVFFPGTNVLEVGLCNPNILLHPGPSLLMTAAIEKGNPFIYREFTPSVRRIVKGMFTERDAILHTLGLQPLFSFAELEELLSQPGIQETLGAGFHVGSIYHGRWPDGVSGFGINGGSDWGANSALQGSYDLTLDHVRGGLFSWRAAI